MMSWNSTFFSMPSSYLMEYVTLMSDYIIMFLISTIIFVSLIMIFSFNCNFMDSDFIEHNQMEFIWTVLPFFILMFICVPSLYCLYFIDTCLFCGLTAKIVGHQWYWTYSYDFMDKITFDSYMVNDSSVRLVSTDNSFVLPSLVPLRLIVSSSDVLHSWTVPSLGIKSDAIPGRINQLCVTINSTGILLGQCSEICGANHSFMPIVLESVNLGSFFKMFS